MEKLLQLRREYLEEVVVRGTLGAARGAEASEAQIEESRRPRKARTAFSDAQLQLLESAFEQHKYLR